MKKWVSETVKNDFQKWNNGDIITIEAGTGSGKSHFIKTQLYAWAKSRNEKILFLIHRKNCVNQFNMELKEGNKEDVIHIKTYQHIESKLKNSQSEFDFSEYKYIVCDEFHYFMADASFNKSTDISLNQILTQNNSVRIFMSATGDYVSRYIKKVKKLETIDYKIPINYNYIKSLEFINTDEGIDSVLTEKIDNNEKSIFFIQSAKKAYELYVKNKDHCMFNCSESNEYYKYVDSEKVNNMLKNERFEDLILITTTTMDAGVNIKDLDIKHILIDVDDIGIIQQCMGRKRIQKSGDSFHLYIKTRNNKILGGRYTQLNKKIEKANYFKNNGEIEYIENYFKEYDRDYLIYDDVVDGKPAKRLNELMYFKTISDMNIINEMLEYDNYGFCKYIANLLEFVDFNNTYRYSILEDENSKKSIGNYLDSIVGKELNKEDRNSLIDIIGLKDGRGRVQGTFKQMNVYLEENYPSYIIILSRKSYRDENNKTKVKKHPVCWMVCRIITE